MMSSLNKGLAKVEVGLAWDPSTPGEAPHDLDIVAATYTTDDPSGRPAYLVHFDSRSPDGTITLNRDSKTGQGFGFDEVMTLELDRLASDYARVVIGVTIQQSGGELVFGDVGNVRVRIREDHTDLLEHGFADIPAARSATVAEFVRDEDSTWEMREIYQGFDADPGTFADVMGSAGPV
ncbi:TerD-family protein [Streptomyces triticagri]|uniref:TerD-family protein n=1 Tax=Streptomyces triticagri TaxID=2293568 RepID=A0A372M1S9_9ACTN|nr:TerD-family protein [Streptomyces triticagri]